MTRVFIVTRSSTNRAALASLLRDARLEVVGSGAKAAFSEAHSRERLPDVVLVDGEDAVAFSRLGLAQGPPVVLLADELSRSDIRDAIHNGARAIVNRDSSREEVAAAVEAAAAGLTAFGAEQMDALLPLRAGRFMEDGSPSEHLTPREIEVLGLLSEGAGNKRIADRLKVSEHTVKFHVSSILGKLGAASRTEAVAEGIRRGFVLM